MATETILQAEAAESDRRAAVLDRLAGDLEREAAGLAGGFDGVLRAFAPAAWRGPAATRAQEALLADQVRVRRAADELRLVAALLRRRAGDASTVSSELRRHADRLRQDRVRQLRPAHPG